MQITNEMLEAADAVKVSGRSFKAVVLMGEVLEKLGNLQQAAAHAEQRLALAEASLAETADKHKAICTDLEGAIEAHKNIDAKVQQLIDEAKAKAKVEAQAIMDDARAKIKEWEDAAVLRIEQQDKLVEIAKGHLQNVHAKIDAAIVAHNELQEKIEKTKGDLRALIGG